MKTTIITLIILIILGLGGYFIYSYYNNDNYQTPSQPYTAPASDTSSTSTDDTYGANMYMSASTTVQVPPVNVTTETTSSTASISIKNFAFNPASINIKVGTKVTWTNNDSAPHTVTSDSGTFLNSPTLAQGQSYSVTFTKAGSYSYHCTVHPMMKATVVVTN